MIIRQSLAALILALSLGVPVVAAENAQERRAEVTVVVEQLPVDVSRIRKALQQSRDVETREGLNLRYLVHIYGSGPAFELFTDQDNLLNGPVPYGAPTHREIINHITPQEYRAPAMDFSALMRWLADRNKEKKGKK